MRRSPAAASSPFKRVTAAECESTNPPTIRDRSETASSGPRAPLVCRLSPNRAMPMAMLTRGSTSTSAAWEAPIGPAWKAFWVRKTEASPNPASA